MKLTTTQFEAKMYRESYFQFFRKFWKLISAEELILNWHIEYLCNELQLVAERVIAGQHKEYDIICNCPPGTSKSSIFSVLFQPWVWTRMPSARFITGSFSERLALDLSRKSRDVVMSEEYHRLFPEIELREDQNTKGYFVNSKGGMRYAVGVGGSVIGMHAHFLIPDDPIDPQGVLSDLIMAEANVWLGETLSQRKVDKMLTPTLMVMQRLHQNDPTGNWLERGGNIKHIVLPATDEDEIKPEYLKVRYSDGLLDLKRLPQKALDEAYEKLQEVGYAGQYRQNPVPRGGAMFKVDRLMTDPHPPTQWKQIVRYWDKAISKKEKAAWSVGAKLGFDLKDNVWILDIRRGRWGSAERETVIQRTAQMDGKKVRLAMEQEPASSGKKSAENSAFNLALAGFHAKLDKVTGDKIMRADTFSVAVNCGRVILVPAPWNHDFIEEMRFFPFSRFKDQIDACCLVAGTQIETLSGLKAIESIRVGDYVLTRFGWRRVKWAGKTGGVDELTAVSFVNGSVLVGTFDHPVLTQDMEWITISELSCEDRTLTWNPLRGNRLWQKGTNTNMSRWSLRGSLSDEGYQMEDTSGEGVAKTHCIGLCGGVLTETSPQAMRFITRMTTPLTTKLKISNVSRKVNTENFIERTREHRSILSTWLESDLLRLLGTVPRRERNSILEMARSQRLGGLVSPTPVNGVVKDFSQPRQQNTAQQNALTRADITPVSGLSMRSDAKSAVLISWLQKQSPYFAQESADQNTWPVYNLEVEDIPEFFANGVLVHNSGAFAMGAKPRLKVGKF